MEKFHLTINYCVESVEIRSYFWVAFSRIRTESEYRKIRTRNSSVFGHFSSSEMNRPLYS